MSKSYFGLSATNETFYAALADAVRAVCALDAAGSTIKDIDVRGGKAVLQIDRPPRFVHGAAAVTMRIGREIHRRMAAPWCGTQIEWLERECPLAPGAEIAS